MIANYERRKVLRILELNEIEIDIVNKINVKNEELDRFANLVVQYKKNKVPLDILPKQWPIFIQLNTKDSSSLHSFERRFGKHIALKLFEERNAKTIQTKEKFIKKYGQEETKRRLKAKSGHIDSYYARHGIMEGYKRWQHYCKKRAATFRLRRGTYGRHNLLWFQNKYGIEKGFQVWNKKRKNQAFKVSYAYYDDIYGVASKEMMRLTKSRGYDYYIRTYGIEIGTLRYKQKLENVINAMKRNNFGNQSKWASELCAKLNQSIVDLKYYGENELWWFVPEEYQAKLKQRVVKPDLYYKGKVIEFQGDIFHGNPKIFAAKDKVHPYNRQITVAELNELDSARLCYMKNKGYQVIEVWENDYKINPIEVIERCISFLS
jgi:hypothetical protein